MLGLAFSTACVARAAAPLPPDLVALEQSMSHLKVISERFSVKLELTRVQEGEAPKHAVLASLSGEVGETPPQVSMQIVAFGQRRVYREIGSATYERRSQIAGFDGGRPWVRGRELSVGGESSPELNPGHLLLDIPSAGQSGFAALVEELGNAQSVVELGPTTVDGQQLMRFDATLDPALLLKGSNSLSQIVVGNGTPQGKAQAKPAPTPTLMLELLVAPSGLPVRARTTLAAADVTMVSDTDLKAINIPVHVTPPSARLVIGEAQLQRFERRREQRYLRALTKSEHASLEAQRKCLRLHRHRRLACLRAHRPHLPPRPPGSTSGLSARIGPVGFGELL